MKVLVLDDEEFLAENLCRFLGQMPEISVQYATSVKEAFQLMNEKAYDLIISDLKLPDESDESWVLKIPSVKPEHQIIFMSSYPIPRYIKENNELNIVGYFEKPFDVTKIIQLINHLNQKESSIC